MLTKITKSIIRYSFSAKKIEFHDKCRNHILRTTSLIQRVTEITLGPYGRNIMIANEMRQEAPRITKDGVTVVKNIQFEDRLDQAISQLVKNSIDYTNKYAGDGTTTSTLLIGQIMKEALKQVSIGTQPKKIRKGLEIGRQLCIQFIEASKREIATKEQLYNVAMISTNGKHKISELISDTVFKATDVKIEKSKKSTNSVQFYSGFKFVRGIESEELVNTKQGNIVYNFPFVLTSQAPIKNVKQITKALELAKKARKQLIIIARDLSDSVKSTIIYNNKKKILEAAFITVPPYGQVGQQLISKIAAQTNSCLFGKEYEFDSPKLQDITFDHFGKCRRITIEKFQTKMQAMEQKDANNLQAIIEVGGPNQTEMLENYDHLVDALNSVTTAKKEGVVAGGGITYWRMAQLLSSYEGEGEQGVKILAKVLKIPRKKLMQYVPNEKQPLLGQNWQGYDLKQQKIVDMFQAGIVDSANVAKSAIIDSLSLCNVLIEVSVGISRTDKNFSNVSLKDLNAKYKL